MAKFKVGDKVKILDGSKICRYVCGYDSDMNKFIGKVETIAQIIKFGDRTGYRMKEIGYTWDERGLKLASNNNEKIVITTDGTTTTAKKYHGKTVVATATATCNPDDKFDFDAGAKIAFERLTGETDTTETTDEKPLNTKICIVDGDREFKTGQIYDIVNGKIRQRDGFVVPIIGKFHSIAKVESYFSPRGERKYLSGCGWSDKKIKFVEVIE